jgi:hypothetical protein
MNMIDKNKMSIETSSPTSPIHVNSVISPISKNNNINYNSTQSTTNMFSNYIPHENKVMKNDKIYNTVLNNNINKAVPLKTEETNTNRKKPTYFKSKSLDLNINQLNEIVNSNQMKCINNSNSIQKLNESSTAEDSSSLRNTNDLTSSNNIGKIQSMKNGIFINKSISTLSQIAEYGTTNPKQINNMYRRGITLNNNNTVTLSANHYERNIKEKFKTDLANSTKIIIAQRISSIEHADKIIVMNEGEITGIGTHDELVESNTEYREIYISQTGKKED